MGEQRILLLVGGYDVHWRQQPAMLCEYRKNGLCEQGRINRALPAKNAGEGEVNEPVERIHGRNAYCSMRRAA